MGNISSRSSVEPEEVIEPSETTEQESVIATPVPAPRKQVGPKSILKQERTYERSKHKTTLACGDSLLSKKPRRPKYAKKKIPQHKSEPLVRQLLRAEASKVERDALAQGNGPHVPKQFLSAPGMELTGPRTKPRKELNPLLCYSFSLPISPLAAPVSKKPWWRKFVR